MCVHDRPRLFGLAILIFVSAPLSARGQAEPPAAPSPESLLREMSAELKNAGAYRFHAEINFDELFNPGVKLQYAGVADFTVRRPNGVYIDYRDDVSAKRFWYDGKAATLLDVVLAKYSTVALEGDLDSAVTQLQERYDLSLPLADLISTDVFALIEERAVAWGYIGVGDVEGTPAHHVAVAGDDADLQVWIQKDGRPLPLKILITSAPTRSCANRPRSTLITVAILG